MTLPGPGIIGGPRGLSESETERREAGPRLTEAECQSEDEARMQHSRSHNRPDKPEPEPEAGHSRAQARVSGLSTELLGSVCHRPRPLSHMSRALSNSGEKISETVEEFFKEVSHLSSNANQLICT